MHLEMIRVETAGRHIATPPPFFPTDGKNVIASPE
jgi:hypothetical protein